MTLTLPLSEQCLSNELDLALVLSNELDLALVLSNELDLALVCAVLEYGLMQ